MDFCEKNSFGETPKATPETGVLPELGNPLAESFVALEA